MLDPKLIERNIDLVSEKLATRGFETDLSEFAVLNSRRKEIIKKVETLEHRRNEGSRKVGALKRSGDQRGLSELLPELKALSEEIKNLNENKAETEGLLREFLLNVPNMPDSSVPEGPDDTANVEIRKWGEPRNFDFEVKGSRAAGGRTRHTGSSEGDEDRGARGLRFTKTRARGLRELL